jgi:DNA-binding IclR family transcriptional regulator
MTGRIQAVERALRILEILASAEAPKSLSQISAGVGLHVSTTYRLLATLRHRGFVEQDSEGGRYRVGVEAFRVGSSFLEEGNLGPRIRPVLVDLAARTGETANLVVRHGLEAVYIDHVIGLQVAKLFTSIGQRVPLHCTAVGKVLLAYEPDAQVREFLSGLALMRLTRRTITTRAAFVRELAAVRAAGYAVDREEHEIGVACVAAPVHDAAGTVVAAIGISGPAGRVLSQERLLSRVLSASAGAASRALGHQARRPASRGIPAAGLAAARGGGRRPT